MTLNFRHFDDLPLLNPPLREVICQISFAPLLKVVQKLPTDFQEKIRMKFPNFSVRQTIGLDPNQTLPNDYEFKSADEQSSVSLSINFIALSTKKYSHWNAFQSEIQEILNAFHAVYGELLTTRIGLRYINLLSSTALKIDEKEDVLNILNDDLMCLINNKAWTIPNNVYHQISLMDEDNSLTIRINFGERVNKKESAIILDFDFYKNNESPILIDMNGIISLINTFHSRCYDVFRWSIKEEKIHIFQPAS